MSLCFPPGFSLGGGGGGDVITSDVITDAGGADELSVLGLDLLNYDYVLRFYVQQRIGSGTNYLLRINENATDISYAFLYLVNQFQVRNMEIKLWGIPANGLLYLAANMRAIGDVEDTQTYSNPIANMNSVQISTGGTAKVMDQGSRLDVKRIVKQ